MTVGFDQHGRAEGGERPVAGRPGQAEVEREDRIAGVPGTLELVDDLAPAAP